MAAHAGRLHVSSIVFMLDNGIFYELDSAKNITNYTVGTAATFNINGVNRFGFAALVLPIVSPGQEIV